ncbi:MAG: metal-dependent hydrolase [Desulfuromonas thiophila]|jgi:inner membrane protein|nr:metal-dependent hydrolase [Desulfuromonas thiophila]
MMAHTHVLIGVSGYTALAMASNGSLPLDSMTIGAAALGSLAPDIDHPGSWLGRRLFFVSLPLSALIGHRGATHSLIASVAASAGMWWYLQYGSTPLPWLVAFLFGYISHLFADWNSNSGVPFFWPQKTRYRAPWAINTGGFIEHLFAVGFGALLTWAGWDLFVTGAWRQLPIF